MIEQKDKDLEAQVKRLSEMLADSNRYYNKTSNELRDFRDKERKCEVEHVCWGHALGMTLVVAATLFFIGLVAGYGVRRVSDYVPEPVKQPWQVHLEKLKHENLVNIKVKGYYITQR